MVRSDQSLMGLGSAKRLRRLPILYAIANSQTPAKVVQKLARHSVPRLTFNTYARTFERAEQNALNCLPDFGNFVLDTCLDKNCIKQEKYVNNYRQQNGQDDLENAALACNEIAPRGFEPLLPG